MAVTLGHNQYGKAETRVVRVFRDSEPNEIADYNVSVALAGDFADVHLTGDNRKCLTTDATKNTVNAYAKEAGDAVREPESFGIALAKHFVDDVPQVSRVRMTLEAYPWDRLSSGGSPHPHAFSRRGAYVRTATVTYDGSELCVVSGVRDLVVLKTTDSEFHTFYEDRYTTLQPTNDRIMATSVTAQWAAHRSRHRLGRLVRPRPGDPRRDVRPPPQPRAAADPLRDGRGHHHRAA
jgi:urate oxidase